MSAARENPVALTRPRADTYRVEDLVSMVRSGEVRVPGFQRGIKWTPTDALALVDSIERGYPIGTLLLWKRSAGAARLVHGSVVVDAPALADALWVVDGQQRIVALTRLLAGAGHPEEPFSAFYDLSSRTFKRLRRHQEPGPHDLPLTEVVDSSRLVEWLFAHPALGESQRRAAIQLGKRLREYEVPAYVVDTDNEDIVREIFRRTNNTGKGMSDSEVFHGLYGAHGSEPASLAEVASGLVGLGFGVPKPDDLYNMMLATRSTDLSKDRVPTLAQEEADQSLADLAASARLVFEFLRADAGVAHLSLLPYTPPLLALTRFFHRHPEPHERTRELLKRWLWRGAITGEHNFDGGALRRALTAIDADEHAAVQSLLRLNRSGRPTEPRDLDRYSFGHAQSKLQLMAMLDLGPRSLTSGEEVAPDRRDLSEWDAYKDLVQAILPHAKGVHRGLADRIVHPPQRGGIASAIVECDEPRLLATHAISDDARRALKLGREDDFLRERRRDLAEIVESFLARQAAWDEIDTPPIEALRLLTEPAPA